MPVTINGTTGITTPAENTSALTVGSITGILKATSGVVSQAVAGTDYSQLTLATAQTAPFTAPNTYADFTGIPSWAKRITVMFNGVSLSGSSSPLIQLGTSSGPTISGYISQSAGITAGVGVTSYTTGFGIRSNGNANLVYGAASIVTQGNNLWNAFGVLSLQTAEAFTVSGGITLSATLDRIRITTGNGTDTFDAGTINISYE